MTAPTKTDVFQTTTGGTTVTFTSGSAYTLNDIVFVLLFERPQTAGDFSSNVTVGGGASGVVAHVENGQTGQRLKIWRCTAGSGTDVVITLPAGTTNRLQCNALQFPAADIGATDLTATGAQETSVTTMASPPTSATLSQANELILAILADTTGAGNELDGPTSGYTQTMEEDTNNDLCCVAGWKQVASTAAVSANITATNATVLKGILVTVRLVGTILTAVAGAYALSGETALVDLSMNAVAGSFALTGQDATLRYGRALTAEAGSYVLTGATSGLSYSIQYIPRTLSTKIGISL